MNWLTKQVCEFLSDLLGDFIVKFENAIVNIFENGADFAQKSEVVGASKAVTLIAATLVVVMVAKEIISTYILEMDGDPDGDPFQLVVKASKALCLICCNEYIFDNVNLYSSTFIKDLNISVKPEKIFDSIDDFLKVITKITDPIIVIFVVIYAAFFVVLTIKAAIRGVELALMKILWSIFALDVITVSGERWNNFFTTYMVTFFGYGGQLLCFSLSIACFTRGLTGNYEELLYAAACMFFALNAPKFLEKFAYSSGLSKVARGGIMGTMQLSMMMGRLK